MATIPTKLQGETQDAFIKRITAMLVQAQEALAEKSKPATLTAKVSEKGAVSVYGLQRMPVTLYMEQWQRLIAFVPALEAFIGANEAKLARKGDAPRVAAPPAAAVPTDLTALLAAMQAGQHKQ